MEITNQEKRFWRILATFVVAGILLIWGAHFWPENWVQRRLLATSVGEAFIVAAILGLTVDRYIKGDLIRKASQDVHKYLVGYNLPEEIKERIQQLMGTVFVRRDWHIAYTLTPSEKDDEVVIDVAYSYELENVSNEVQPQRRRTEAKGKVCMANETSQPPWLTSEFFRRKFSRNFRTLQHLSFDQA